MFKDKESMKENFAFRVDYKPHSVVRFSEQAGVLQPVPGWNHPAYASSMLEIIWSYWTVL